MRPIGFVLSPGFQVMSFAALSVFEFANKEMGEPVYDVRVLSETGGLMRSSIGVSIATEPLDATIFDTLFFCRGTEPSTPGLIEFLRQAPERCRRVAATCTGAFILAAAGDPAKCVGGGRSLNNGRSCSTPKARNSRKLSIGASVDGSSIR